MVWQQVVLIIISTAVVSLTFISLLYAWPRRHATGFWLFFGLAGAATWWNAFNTAEKLSSTLEAKVFWAKVQYPGVLGLGVLWFSFALEYSQQKHLLKGYRSWALWIIPALGVAATWTNELHHLIWTNIVLQPAGHGMGAIYTHGGLFFVLSIYNYVMLAAGMVILILQTRRQASIRRQNSVMMAGFAAPWIINLLYLMGYSPIRGMDLTPQVMVIATCALAWTVWQYRMLELVPLAREAVLDLLTDGVLIVDESGLVIEVNPRAAQILSLRRSQILGSPVKDAFKRWNSTFDPSCPGQDVVLALTPTPPGMDPSPNSQITRQVRDYELSSTPLQDEQGKTIGYFLLLRDITDQLRDEERLRLQSVALKAAANGIVITDKEGSIEWVNPAFTEMTGYSFDEAMGQNPRILKSNTHDSDFYADMWQTIMAGQSWRGELINRRKDGRFYDEEMTIAPVLSAEGEIINFIAIKQDISARKRAEVALQQSLAEKQRLQEAEAILQERNRIAQEIHDGLAQNLAALRMRMGRWRRMVEHDPARLNPELDEAEELVTASLQEARRSIFALRPLALEARGFAGALQQFFNGFGEYYGLQVHSKLTVAREAPSLNRVTELTLFRIIQEGLNNIAKHAHAKNAWVELIETPEDGKINLTIRDDGCGFDLAGLDEAEQSGHYGLRSMQERVQSVGGQWKISSSPGHGVCLEIQLPIKNSQKGR